MRKDMREGGNMQNLRFKKWLALVLGTAMIGTAVPAAAADFTAETDTAADFTVETDTAADFTVETDTEADFAAEAAAAEDAFTDSDTDETLSAGESTAAREQITSDPSGADTDWEEALAAGTSSETGGSSVAEDVKFVPGTYTITANLFVPGDLNTQLPGVTAYMTNPNNPLGLVDENGSCEKKIPNEPVSGNASITIGSDGVTKTLTIPVKNPVFTLQQINSGDTVEVLDQTRNNTVYSDLGGKTSKTGRITKLVVNLKNNTGEYTFTDCVEYPTLLATEWTVPISLSVDLESVPLQTEGESSNPEETGKIKIARPKVNSLTYNGKTQTGVTEGTGYLLTGTTAASEAGTYKARAVLKDGYVWSDGNTESIVLEWKIKKADQTVTTKVAEKKIQASSLTKKSVSFSIGAAGTGTLSYKVTVTPDGASKYISVNKNGKVTLKKGAKAGNYTILVTAGGNTNYSAGVKNILIRVVKGTQTVKVRTASKKMKYSALKKKAGSFNIGASAKTKLKYKIAGTPKKGAKYISVNSKGKVTIKKKAPKGTYRIKVTAAGNSLYKGASKTVKITVK